eukprot:554742_1
MCNKRFCSYTCHLKAHNLMKRNKKTGGIRNNPRLKLRSNKDNPSDDESAQIMTDYEYIANCLSSPNIALKPQRLLEYIAITIKIYVGACLNVNMHQRTFIINTQNGFKCGLQSIQSNQVSLPVDIKSLHEFTRIGVIAPIIYKHTLQEEKGHEASQQDKIAILQERKTRITANDIRRGILFPYILDHERYEWYLWNNVYLSTMQKNYEWHRNIIEALAEQGTDEGWRRRMYFQQTFLSNTYAKTRNVIKCIIICNSKRNERLCLFSTTSGLFYTDYRLCYGAIHDADKASMHVSIPLIHRKSNNITAMRHVAHRYDLSDVFVDLWSQGSNDIYIWDSNTYMLYTVEFNTIALNKMAEDGFDLAKMVQKMDAVNPAGDDEDNGADAVQMHIDAMNDRLRMNGLLIANEMFTIDTKKSIYGHSVKPQLDHCEIKAVYYENGIGEHVAAVYWVERSIDSIISNRSKLGNWRFGAIAKDHLFKSSKQKSIHRKLKNKENDFFRTAPKGLTEETFYIAFVDEREVNNKKWVIILKQHVVIIPLLKKDDVEDEQNAKPFARCFKVKDVAPKLLLLNDEINFQSINQWHYNYSNATLYIFEKMAAHGVYPYRMNEIALNNFKFD